MRTERRRQLFLTGSALVVTLTLVGGYILYLQVVNQQMDHTGGEFSITIDFAGLRENIRRNLRTDGETSLFAIMSENFNVSYDEYPGLGHLITGIENVLSDVNRTGTYWIYYVNGERANVGADLYFPSSGDNVTWRYE